MANNNGRQAGGGGGNSNSMNEHVEFTVKVRKTSCCMYETIPAVLKY